MRRVTAGDAAAVARVAAEFRPDWILHAGSLSASAWDLPANDPAWSGELAVVRALLDVARATAARLTVVLTDAVFTGPRMFHDESAPTGSGHPAAAHAVAIEQVLGDTVALVVRTHAYGWVPRAESPGRWSESTPNSPPVGRPRILRRLSTGAGMRRRSWPAIWPCSWIGPGD